MSEARRPRPEPAVVDREPVGADRGPTEGGPDPDAPLPPALVAVGVALLVLTAALGAVISVLLTPARIGATLVPFAVVVAIALNVALPWLGYRLTHSRGVATVPVLVFFAAGWAMSIAPGGDVLLAGGSNGQTAISYATLLGAMIAGALTAVRVR